jgi:superfamily I DNA/RNA helicase
MSNQVTQILFGPPGTGKTFNLLGIVKMRIKDGLSPSQICFITFTRKAAGEAKSRAIEKFTLQDHDLPWFRTLHSLAFSQLGYNKSQIMGLGDYIKICEMLGLRITYKTINDDGTFAGQTVGDRLFFAENMARARMIPLMEYWETLPDEDLLWAELERLSKTLADYKATNSKVDFTDIIHEFCERGEAPPCQVLIVDEAQDLSPLQWRMVERLMSHIPEVYVAGDDDQAIFRWAGADVEKLIKLPGQQTILGRSFRVPRKVQEVAHRIVNRINERVPKEWEARDFDGAVDYCTDIAAIDMSKGTWLLLARNAYLLDEYTQHCLREGFMFTAQRDSAMRWESFIAIRDWEELRRGRKVHASSVKLIYDLMSVRVGVTYGFKGKVADLPDRQLIDMVELKNKYGLCCDASMMWNIALDKMSQQEASFFLACIARGEVLGEEPRIKISTIHGAKGGEAENVVVLTDMAWRTYQEYQKYPDDEHRVWYVGITRAKENLFIVQPRTQLCYDV